MNLEPNRKYRIEFRSYNIGATSTSGFGSGFAHNFIAVFEIGNDGRAYLIGELHGMPRDRATLRLIDLDITGRGRLEVVPGFAGGMGRRFIDDSARHPRVVLFEGTGRDASERLDRAFAAAAWINNQDFDYGLVGRNSNSVAYTLALAMGYRVAGQPLRKDGQTSLRLQSGTIDLRAGRPDAPAAYPGAPKEISGYADIDPSAPIVAPERVAPAPRPAIPRRGGERREPVPALDFGLAPRLGHDAVAGIRAALGFDPRIEGKTMEQNASIRAWLADSLAPKLGLAGLPPALGGDLLLRAAREGAGPAVRALQAGLNRFEGAKVAVDGWVGPETLGALDRHAAEHGPARVRQAVALAGARRDLDGLARGEIRAEHAPTLFGDTIGRLFEAPDAPRPQYGASWFRPEPPASRAQVRAVQRAINETGAIFGHLPEALVEDGDFGPKTGAAYVATAKAAGGERLSDHIGKRLGIGEPSLAGDPWRGFDRALGVKTPDPDAAITDERRDDELGGDFWR